MISSTDFNRLRISKAIGIPPMPPPMITISAMLFTLRYLVRNLGQNAQGEVDLAQHHVDSCFCFGAGWIGYNRLMSTEISRLRSQLSDALLHRRQKVCTAESCTGGLIAKTFTDLAGSSDWFDRGFVTYSNAAKHEMLGVSASLIEDYGAVSEPVANAMASGALRRSEADYAIAVTGVAGPGGGSEEKPVGTVWIAVASADHLEAQCHQFDGDRAAVREATLVAGLEMLIERVSHS